MTLDNEIDNLIKEKTSIGEAFENMDSDELLDKNTRLTERELKAVIVVDELKNLGVLSKKVTITEQIKKLSISRDGKGRREKVEMVVAERSQGDGRKWWQKMLNVGEK